jgi:uncharacterized protein HemY
MTPQEQHQAVADAGRVVGLWTLIGITSWTEAAAFFAAILSVLMILEWFWKRVFRSIFEARGWVAPRRRRWYDHRRQDFEATRPPVQGELLPGPDDAEKKP